MDRFDALRAFVMAVESGSLTRAADVLQVATSAVSRRIKDLEAHLGTQLLQRTTRQMRLTAAGERFHRRAVELLQALEEAEAEAGDQSRALAGPLRIAAPLSFGRRHLSARLLAFAEANPGLSLDVDFSDRMVDLVAEGYDLAVRIGRLPDSSLIARKLCDVRLVVVASPGFWDRHGRPDKPEDLIGLPTLCYSGTERSEIWSYTGPDGRETTMEMQVAMRATNGGFLTEAAIRGMGVAILPSFIVNEAIEAGELDPVLTSVAWPLRTIHVVYPQTRHLPARVRALIDDLRAWIGPEPDWEECLRPG